MENTFANVPADTIRNWKLLGFGDEQIATVALKDKFGEVSAKDIQDASLIFRKIRLGLGVHPVVKKIDTTAGEYPFSFKLLIHVIRWSFPR